MAEVERKGGSHSGKEMGSNYKSRGRFWKALTAWSLLLMGFHPKHWVAREGVWCRGMCSAHKPWSTDPQHGHPGSRGCPRPTESEYVLEQDAQVTPALVQAGGALA